MDKSKEASDRINRTDMGEDKDDEDLNIIYSTKISSFADEIDAIKRGTAVDELAIFFGEF